MLTASASYSRTLSSPNYPLRYGNNVHCKWVLKVDNDLPADGYIVKVAFRHDFKLEGVIHGHCSDDITFYDGNSTASNLLGSFCDKTRPDVLYSTGQYLYVEFNTDRLVAYKGFTFSFSAVRKGMNRLFYSAVVLSSFFSKLIITIQLFDWSELPWHLNYFVDYIGLAKPKSRVKTHLWLMNPVHVLAI